MNLAAQELFFFAKFLEIFKSDVLNFIIGSISFSYRLGKGLFRKKLRSLQILLKFMSHDSDQSRGGGGRGGKNRLKLEFTSYDFNIRMKKVFKNALTPVQLLCNH